MDKQPGNKERPLSNLQREFLKLFSQDVSAEELRDIKRLIADYYAKKAVEAANKVYTAKNWTEQQMDDFLNTHMRASK